MTIKYKCKYCHIVLTTKYGAATHRCSTMPNLPVDTATPPNAFTTFTDTTIFSSTASSDSFSGGGGDFGGGGASGGFD